MTDEEIESLLTGLGPEVVLRLSKRIKVAQSDGWQDIHIPVSWLPQELRGTLTKPKEGSTSEVLAWTDKEVPDYFEDLAAIRRVIRKMDKAGRDRFLQWLLVLAHDFAPKPQPPVRERSLECLDWCLVDAPAELFVEAYGKAARLW